MLPCYADAAAATLLCTNGAAQFLTAPALPPYGRHVSLFVFVVDSDCQLDEQLIIVDYIPLI